MRTLKSENTIVVMLNVEETRKLRAVANYRGVTEHQQMIDSIETLYDAYTKATKNVSR